MIWVIVGVAVVVVAGVAWLLVKRRASPDGVALFQRQIDALSPEARRSVVDRVQQFDDGDDDPTAGGPPHGPDSTRLPPDGTRLPPDGTRLPPDGRGVDGA